MNDYVFGGFLYELRTEKGLSQSQLGDIMGVSNKAVSKWEMGVSKPRPAMLVVLASFFGVTVEELLAGKRNTEAEQREHEKSEDTALKLWAGEYLKKKKRGKNAIITACLLPFCFFVCAVIIIAAKLGDTALGPILVALVFLAEVVDIALIFVFYGSARRLKRILYATYPEQAEHIAVLISPQREKFPVSRREKILLIISSVLMVSCSILCRISINAGSGAWRTVGIFAVVIMIAATIVYVAVLSHYLWRYRHRK